MKKSSWVSLQQDSPPSAARPRPPRVAPDGGEAGADLSAHLRDWMEKGMRGLPRDSAILAIGCEEAFLAPQLTEYATDVTVLDTCAGQIAQLARRFPEVNFMQHQLCDPLPFSHESFDAIWCCEYLDRVFDPVSALREMQRLLVPGGRLLLTVPNHGPMRSLIGALFKEEAEAAPMNPRLQHFSKSTLAVLAHDAGCSEIDVCTGGGTWKLGGQWLPRSLFLTARKGPGARVTPAGQPATREVEGLWDDLAFAGRTLAA